MHSFESKSPCFPTTILMTAFRQLAPGPDSRTGEYSQFLLNNLKINNAMAAGRKWLSYRDAQPIYLVRSNYSAAQTRQQDGPYSHPLSSFLAFLPRALRLCPLAHSAGQLFLFSVLCLYVFSDIHFATTMLYKIFSEMESLTPFLYMCQPSKY